MSLNVYGMWLLIENLWKQSKGAKDGMPQKCRWYNYEHSLQCYLFQWVEDATATKWLICLKKDKPVEPQIILTMQYSIGKSMFVCRFTEHWSSVEMHRPWRAKWKCRDKEWNFSVLGQAKYGQAILSSKCQPVTTLNSDASIGCEWLCRICWYMLHSSQYCSDAHKKQDILIGFKTFIMKSC